MTTDDTYSPLLHDALPIFSALPALQRANRDRSGRLPECLDDIETSPLTRHGHGASPRLVSSHRALPGRGALGDRKSTRLNSSHVAISYAVFCLKKKKASGWWTVRTSRYKSTVISSGCDA